MAIGPHARTRGRTERERIAGRPRKAEEDETVRLVLEEGKKQFGEANDDQLLARYNTLKQ